MGAAASAGGAGKGRWSRRGKWASRGGRRRERRPSCSGRAPATACGGWRRAAGGDSPQVRGGAGGPARRCPPAGRAGPGRASAVPVGAEQVRAAVAGPGGGLPAPAGPLPAPLERGSGLLPACGLGGGPAPRERGYRGPACRPSDSHATRSEDSRARFIFTKA